MKPGLDWTMDWTVDWTLDWTVDWTLDWTAWGAFTLAHLAQLAKEKEFKLLFSPTFYQSESKFSDVGHNKEFCQRLIDPPKAGN